jgi:hypothetical protein
MSTCRIITDGFVTIQGTLTDGIDSVSVSNEFTLLQGWQHLKIHPGDTAYEIKDILLNGSSIKELIFTSWSTTNNDIYQPCTHVRDAVWNIILHDNPAVFAERYKGQIPNGKFGKNIINDMVQYIDMATPAPEHLEDSLKNFFEHGFGVNYYKKDYKRLPYSITDLKKDDEYLFSDIKKLHYKPVGVTGNKHSQWFNATCDINHPDFSNIRSWLFDNGLTGIVKMAVNLVKPAGYINLHLDDFGIVEDRSQVLYVPLFNTPDAKIKVAHAGVLPTNRVCILNSSKFVHGSYSMLTEDRYALIFRIIFEDEWIDQHWRSPIYP